jgi:hypothetical protein
MPVWCIIIASFESVLYRRCQFTRKEGIRSFLNYYGKQGFMPKESIRLRYVGMLPLMGHREYRFQIEAVDKSFRTIALTIDDIIFRKNLLMFQEAPDLCYQKMLTDCAKESIDYPLCNLAPVTEAEVATYRMAHPVGKIRKTSFR